MTCGEREKAQSLLAFIPICSSCVNPVVAHPVGRKGNAETGSPAFPPSKVRFPRILSARPRGVR